MFRNAITTFAIAVLLSMIMPQASVASSEPNETSRITGAIRTKDGLPVKGVMVYCYYMNREIPWEFGHILSDDQGRYVFELPVSREYWPAGRTCWIGAGGKISTSARSEEFLALPQTNISVEDLIVRPFSASVKGRVVYEDGRPAANLAFGYASRSCSPVDAQKPPQTNSDGGFTIEHLLPDELYSFWVFTESNVYRVWKRLNPNTSTLRLTLRQEDCIELPSDWLGGGHTHLAIAGCMVYAENASIEFELPDLKGETVSLSDDQFKNKAVIVNITGTWCGGCRAEAPYLVKYYNRYKEKGLEVVSISFEREPEGKAIAAVKAFKHEYNINYTLLYGGNTNHQHVESVIKGLKLFRGYPTTIYIDRKGNVQFIHSGFYIHSEPHKKWQLGLMEKHIKAILANEN